MNESLATQLQGESVHLAFLAVVGVLTGVSTLINFLLRRELAHAEKEKDAMRADLDKLEAKYEELREKHGYEIQDSRLAVATLFNELKLQQPQYPSR